MGKTVGEMHHDAHYLPGKASISSLAVKNLLISQIN